VERCLPRGPGAAPLQRLAGEIEMWLHAQPLNEARRQRGEPAVNALWLWGADGRRAPPPPATAQAPAAAFGSDAWLAGLWHLLGSGCRPLPQRLEQVLAHEGAERAVLAMEAGAELQRVKESSVAEAVARLDERFVSPALQALRRGELASVTLIVNDRRATLGRRARWRLWRRRRAGLGSFA
jgi:hypothetical protein